MGFNVFRRRMILLEGVPPGFTDDETEFMWLVQGYTAMLCVLQIQLKWE